MFQHLLCCMTEAVSWGLVFSKPCCMFPSNIPPMWKEPVCTKILVHVNIQWFKIYSELPSKACFVAKSVAFGHISVRNHYSCHIKVFTCAAFLAGRSTFLAGKLPAGQADVCQCFSLCMILFVLLCVLCQMHAASDYWLAWCAFCWRCYLTLRSCHFGCSVCSADALQPALLFTMTMLKPFLSQEDMSAMSDA